MAQETNSNSIDALRFGFKDVITIAALLLTTAGNFFALSSQIRELTGKFEDYRAHQEQMNIQVKQLYDLRFNTLELRLMKLENQAEKSLQK